MTYGMAIEARGVTDSGGGGQVRGKLGGSGRTREYQREPGWTREDQEELIFEDSSDCQ